MSDHISTSAEHPPTPARWRRWFAFLGGGAAWTLHFMGIYLIAEFTCVSGLGNVRWLGLSVTAWAVLGISLILLAIAVAAAWIGRKDSREARQNETGGSYLSHAGWIVSGLFALVIAFESVPMLYYLDGC